MFTWATAKISCGESELGDWARCGILKLCLQASSENEGRAAGPSEVQGRGIMWPDRDGMR